MTSERSRWTTASRLDRAMECPGSTVLPEVEDAEESNALIWGKAVHELVEHGKLTSKWPNWVVKGVEDKVATSGFKRDDYYPTGAHEAKLLLDGTGWSFTTLVLTDGWPKSSTALRVKADFIGERLGEPWIDDLKTGRFAPDPGSMQLAAPALALAQLTGADGVHASITHWPRYPKPALPVRTWHYYDAEELDLVRHRLTIVREDALGPTPTFKTGPHCQWCRAKPNCQTYNAEFAAMAA